MRLREVTGSNPVEVLNFSVNCLSTCNVVSLSELRRFMQRVKICPCEHLRCKRILAGDGLGIGKR